MHAVDFQPGSKGATFLAAETSNLRVWDAHRQQMPLVSCKVSDDTLLCARWSPLEPSLVAVGGVDRALTVIDTRAMPSVSRASAASSSTLKYGNNGARPVAWFQYKAHPRGAINSLAWNPFVPYWLASAGEDGVVNVWDVRYTLGPVARADRSTLAVESVRSL